MGSSSVKPWGETEKRKWNAPSRCASSVPGNDIQRTLSPPWFPLFGGGSGVSGAIANTRIFLFLKKALQVGLFIQSFLRSCSFPVLVLYPVVAPCLSQHSPAISPPPHIYHLKATERVKKTKPFFHFFCLFDFFPTAHSLSAFFSVLHRQIHQASACHSFIDYCLATYFSPVASDTLCPLLSPLPLVNFYNLFPGLSILIRTEDLDPLLPIHPLPSWAPNSLSGTPIRHRRVRAVLVLILALIPPAPRLIG